MKKKSLWKSIITILNWGNHVKLVKLISPLAHSGLSDDGEPSMQIICLQFTLPFNFRRLSFEGLGKSNLNIPTMRLACTQQRIYTTNAYVELDVRTCLTFGQAPDWRCRRRPARDRPDYTILFYFDKSIKIGCWIE